MAAPEEHDQRRIDGVFVEHWHRVSLVMREHYPKVLAANRFFEEETGLHNELGANNLARPLEEARVVARFGFAATAASYSVTEHDPDRPWRIRNQLPNYGGCPGRMASATITVGRRAEKC